jgi:hypothetical protein
MLPQVAAALHLGCHVYLSFDAVLAASSPVAMAAWYLLRNAHPALLFLVPTNGHTKVCRGLPFPVSPRHITHRMRIERALTDRKFSLAADPPQPRARRRAGSQCLDRRWGSH